MSMASATFGSWLDTRRKLRSSSKCDIGLCAPLATGCARWAPMLRIPLYGTNSVKPKHWAGFPELRRQQMSVLAMTCEGFVLYPAGTALRTLMPTSGRDEWRKVGSDGLEIEDWVGALG